MTDFLAEYAAYCEANGRPDRVELMLSDINAILRGKWLPGDDEDKIASGGVRLPLSTYAPNILGEEVETTGLGIAIGDPDGRLTPVPGTLVPVPWAKSGHVVQLLVEMVDETGEVPAYSPRRQLENMLDRFAARGLKPVIATELEFYLYQPREDQNDAPMPPDRSPTAQNYDLEVLERTQGILDAILDAALAQGMSPDTLIAEYGPGQFEVNFHHTDDVLKAADEALTFRRLVRGIARRHGMAATFMAKPYANYPGNGMHVHVSIEDASGANIFDPGAPADGPNAPLKQAVAGTLATMGELQAVFAPHMNSYRRYQPASFAPHTPDWGLDNRAAAIRLPEVTGPGARLEHRIAGADVNPYLVIAAVLGGVLYGFDTPDLPLRAPLDEDMEDTADPLTADWSTAVACFEQSEIAAEIFGASYRDIYTAVRWDEIGQLTTAISQIEYRTYLGRL